MIEASINTVDEGLMGDHLKLAAATYEEPLPSDAKHFWWKHGCGPSGVSISVALRDDSDLVGQALIQRRDFRTGPGEVVRAGLVVDLMLAPAHRSAMNFVTLVRKQGDVPDVDVLLHTSNATSDPLYRKLLRYPVAFELKAYGLPLRMNRLLAKAMGWTMPDVLEALTGPWRLGIRATAITGRRGAGLRFEERLPTTEEFAGLMVDFRERAGPHFERTLAFLDWRFGAGPVFNGTVACVMVGSECRGYVAWRLVDFGGIKSFVVLDIMVPKFLGRLARVSLMLELARHGAACGADIVMTMVNPGSDLLAPYARLPFLPIPDTRLPHATPLFVLPRRTDLGWLRNCSFTYMTLADLDYF